MPTEDQGLNAHGGAGHVPAHAGALQTTTNGKAPKMTTKKLSPSMIKALLATNSDGWLERADASTATRVALIDRKLLTVETYREETGWYGYWLTDAGKAKVAELRGETVPAPASTLPCLASPSHVRGGSKAHNHLLATGPECNKAWTTPAAAEAPEIRTGDLIEIRQPGKRKWAMRVNSMAPLLSGETSLCGTQVRLVDGHPSRYRAVTLQPSEYTIIERAKPAEVGWNGRTFGELTADEKRQATRQAAAQLQSELTRMAPAIGKVLAAETRPAQVTATVADDDNVPALSKAQVDGLHWLGGTDGTRDGERPTRPTINTLRRIKLVAEYSLDLTEAGRAAYLANEPTGRLSKKYGDAWRAANQPELPTLDELDLMIQQYAAAHMSGRVAGVGTLFETIRDTLVVLYREAGR